MIAKSASGRKIICEETEAKPWIQDVEMCVVAALTALMINEVRLTPHLARPRVTLKTSSLSSVNEYKYIITLRTTWFHL